MLFKNSLQISHDMISRAVKAGDTVVDATAGNGYDTCFLAGIVGNTGKVYAFDIQPIAIENTKLKLESSGDRHIVELINDGHENIDQYVKNDVKAIMFNLGYLPKGDHSKGTRAVTTIKAVEKCLKLLIIDGIITIVIYYGGDSGFEEKEAVMEYIKTIDNKKYSVLVHEFVNQPNCPPIAVCIERIV